MAPKDSKKAEDYQKKLKTAGAGESKINKFITRSIFGIIMMAGFAGLVWLGHLPITIFVMILQIMAFRELANVRYKAAKAAKVPRFRTVQWCWFVVALFYAYGKPLLLNILSGKDAQVLEHYHSWISFGLYWMLFIITVLSFRLDDLKYQMGQLTWTLVVIGLTVIQMKSLVMNIFNGLFWFVFPASLVICNDCCAYFCGLSLGKKIFKIPFLSLSPNKTWEGFVGAWILTMAFAFWFPTILTNPHLICPASRSDDWYKCTPNSVFIYVDYRLPTTIASLLGFTTVQLMPIQLHGAFLGAFASLVAPFGGFFASAIKRAYRVKDFDNLIPGHGGVMDRMDCQFLMCLCTAVHYRTFIQVAAITVPVIIKYIERLSRPEQEEVLNYLQKVLASNP